MKTRVILLIAVLGFLVSCNNDSVEPDVIACFEYSPQGSIGVGGEISFTNCSENAYSYTWDFGDGGISNEVSPKHVYELPGAFGVLLISSNDNSTDYTSAIINVTGESNGFYYDGNFYALNNIAICENFSSGKSEIILSSNELIYSCETGEWSDATGDLISFTINQSELTEGTYLLYENGSVDEVSGEFGVDWSPADNTGEHWGEFNYGILNVNSALGKYEITYTFVSSSKRITGYYLEE